MFITPNTTILGGAGFSVPAKSEGYLRTISGTPPLTLEKTLAKPPASITVYGNTGGVGIDLNLLSNVTWEKNRQLSQNGGTTSNTSGRALSASRFVNASEGDVYQLIGNTSYARLGFYSNTSQSSSDILNLLVSVTSGTTYTAPQGTRYIRVSALTAECSSLKLIKNGVAYKIPIVISDGAATKTINLYSDAALGAGDSLEVSPTTQEASRGSTDVKALQDWSQDWNLPKADSISVTTDTTVELSNMAIQYYSKK